MKLYSALQIDEIGTKIAAKIKAITAKTNLLKTAAYKDVGTTAGKIPEFVGNDGMGGFGFGGSAKKLAVGADLDLLPRVNALYTAGRDDGILNRPPELVSYVFGHEFVLECIVGDALSTGLGAYIQRLTFDAYQPGTLEKTNAVVFIRSKSYMGFSTWVRLTGRMYGIDSGGDTIGADAEFNSIKVGVTSSKIAFETKVLQITRENFGYNADGSYKVDKYSSGYNLFRTTIPEDKILSISCRVYKKTSSGKVQYIEPKSLHTLDYYELYLKSAGAFITVKTDAHATEMNYTGQSGERIFDFRGFAELFITYKVD